MDIRVAHAKSGLQILQWGPLLLPIAVDRPLIKSSSSSSGGAFAVGMILFVPHENGKFRNGSARWMQKRSEAG